MKEKNTKKNKLTIIISAVLVIISLSMIVIGTVNWNAKDNKDEATDKKVPVELTEEEKYQKRIEKLTKIGNEMFNDGSYKNLLDIPNINFKMLMIFDLEKRGIDCKDLIDPKCNGGYQIISFYENAEDSPNKKNVYINQLCVLGYEEHKNNSK